MTAKPETIEAIEALDLRIDYVCQRPSPWGESTKKHDVDEWRITMSGADYHFVIPYYTGLGLRKADKRAPKCTYRPGTIGRKHWEEMYLKPVTPTRATVLHSLVMDANSAEQNFEDWCSDFGYSSDSIKNLNTYKSCIDVARMLNKHFGRETVKKLAELLQDF